MEKGTLLRDQFQYYLDHQIDLLKNYDGKFVVIKDFEVVSAYDTEIEAYLDSIKKYELGTFIIQKCSPGDKDYTQYFRSRVAFA